MDRECGGRGQSATEGPDEAFVRLHAVDDRPFGREIAVDRLDADDHLADRHGTPAREADVQHRGELPEGEGPCGGGRGLDGPDAADEAVVPAELTVGGGDEEEIGHARGFGWTGADYRTGMRRRAPAVLLVSLTLALAFAAAGCGDDTDVSEAVDSVRTEAEVQLDEARADLEDALGDLRDDVSDEVGAALDEASTRLDALDESSRAQLEDARDGLRRARDELEPQVEDAVGDAREGLEDALDAIERMLERIEEALRGIG